MEIFFSIALLVIIVLLFRIHERLKIIDVDTNNTRCDTKDNLATIGNLLLTISNQIFSIPSSIDTIEKLIQMNEEEKRDFKIKREKEFKEFIKTSTK